MHGTAQINGFSYNRVNTLEKYKADGEKKYIDYLRDGDNNLKIASLKIDNMEVDSLPLTQNIDFTMDMAAADENYIYVKPNLFTGLGKNPFLKENRTTDINLRYLPGYQISTTIKIPAGYKADALPKNITMTLPDKSMTFRRVAAEQDGAVVVYYIISHKKTIYFKEDYDSFHEFYKKMHEMLDEQIVFKKA